MTVPVPQSTVLLRLEIFADRCGIHPDLIRRFVAMGLIDPADSPADEPMFAVREITRVDRMVRLRSDLGLNYSALGLVIELLDRIEQLEQERNRTPIRN